MAVVLRLVSLGLAARNQVKIKVRQPLAEMKVQAQDERVQRVLERFREPILDELNIKTLQWVPPQQALVSYRVQPDAKQLGPKLGGQFPALMQALSQADSAQHAHWAERIRQGETISVPVGDTSLTLLPSELQVQLVAPDGWVAAEEKGILVLLDTRITPTLKLEGLARDVVRHIQNLRKQAQLELEDRIILYLATPSAELQSALQAHRDYIAAETLTIHWASQPLGDAAAHTEVRLEGYPLRIELRKATPQA
jgi:isoleucyl-tRNA synthetase